MKLLSWVRLWVVFFFFYNSDPRMLFENGLDVNGKILAESLKCWYQVSNFFFVSVLPGPHFGMVMRSREWEGHAEDIKSRTWLKPRLLS